MYEIVTEDEVAGQPTFDAAVKVDEWQEGVMVTLHFERDIHVTSARHASFHGSLDGLSTFELHGQVPPDGNAFHFHGTGAAAVPGHISCTEPFFSAPSPPPPVPPSPLPLPPSPPQPPPAPPPSECILGPRYSLSPSASGFSARLEFARQLPGARVSLHFGAHRVGAPVKVYGAQLLAHSGSEWTLGLETGRDKVVIVASGEPRTPD